MQGPKNNNGCKSMYLRPNTAQDTLESCSSSAPFIQSLRELLVRVEAATGRNVV